MQHKAQMMYSLKIGQNRSHEDEKSLWSMLLLSQLKKQYSTFVKEY